MHDGNLEVLWIDQPHVGTGVFSFAISKWWGGSGGLEWRLPFLVSLLLHKMALKECCIFAMLNGSLGPLHEMLERNLWPQYTFPLAVSEENIR